MRHRRRKPRADCTQATEGAPLLGDPSASRAAGAKGQLRRGRLASRNASGVDDQSRSCCPLWRRTRQAPAAGLPANRVGATVRRQFGSGHPVRGRRSRRWSGRGWPSLGADGRHDRVVGSSGRVAQLEGRADFLAQRRPGCGMAVQDDLGAHSGRQLALQLDEQAAQRGIVRALSPPMQQVVAVDEHQLDAVERAATTQGACPSIGACCCWSTSTASSTAGETRYPAWRRYCASAPPKATASST